MRKIIYYVASSIDGFIAGPNEDIGEFLLEGEGVNQYYADLQSFDTVIMGRKTYEFGYKFGLKPGEPAYPNMKHYIFSNTLSFDKSDSQVVVKEPDLEFIEELKKEEGSDIYLCGGGMFAGWLLDNELIDVLKIKLNPILLGEGTELFGLSKGQYEFSLRDHQSYAEGLQIVTYDITKDQTD